MKKILYFALLAMTVCLTSLNLTSCASDEVEAKPEPVDPWSHAAVTIKYNFSEDMLKLFDISFKVTNFDGNQEEIKVAAPGEVTKEYKTTEKTGKASVAFISTIKSGIELDGSTYNLSAKCSISRSAVDKNGTVTQLHTKTPFVAEEKQVTTKISNEIALQSINNVFGCNKNYTFEVENGNYK